MTLFHTGDMVRATTAAQGLQLGQVYRVCGIAHRDTPFGSFVTYSVTQDGRKVLDISNGHLLLTMAKEAK